MKSCDTCLKESYSNPYSGIGGGHPDCRDCYNHNNYKPRYIDVKPLIIYCRNNIYPNELSKETHLLLNDHIDVRFYDVNNISWIYTPKMWKPKGLWKRFKYWLLTKLGKTNIKL